MVGSAVDGNPAEISATSSLHEAAIDQIEALVPVVSEIKCKFEL